MEKTAIELIGALTNQVEEQKQQIADLIEVADCLNSAIANDPKITNAQARYLNEAQPPLLALTDRVEESEEEADEETAA